jgi:hypothetical protein
MFSSTAAIFLFVNPASFVQAPGFSVGDALPKLAIYNHHGLAFLTVVLLLSQEGAEMYLGGMIRLKRPRLVAQVGMDMTATTTFLLSGLLL